MIVIELMQRSEVSCKAQCKLVGVLDEVFMGSRLCSTVSSKLLNSDNVFGDFFNILKWPIMGASLETRRRTLTNIT